MTTTVHRRNSRPWAVLAATALLSAGAGAQTPNFVGRDVADVPTVKGAPFSGDAVITLKLRHFDGTPVEQTMTGKYYRDGEGRVRREQTVGGLSAVVPFKDSQGLVTIVDPVAGFVYTIVGGTQEALRFSMAMVMPKQLPVPTVPKVPASVDVVKKVEPLGTRTIDGISATGTKTTYTIPAGLLGERAVEVVEERWESAELKLVLLSRQHNPVSGETEYRMTNIRRAEPAADLFRVPAGYKIVDTRGS